MGMDGLRDRINAFTDVGFSKFVVLPVGEPDDWTTHLEEVAAEILPLQRCYRLKAKRSISAASSRGLSPWMLWPAPSNSTTSAEG